MLTAQLILNGSIWSPKWKSKWIEEWKNNENSNSCSKSAKSVRNLWNFLLFLVLSPIAFSDANVDNDMLIHDEILIIRADEYSIATFSIFDFMFTLKRNILISLHSSLQLKSREWTRVRIASYQCVFSSFYLLMFMGEFAEYARVTLIIPNIPIVTTQIIISYPIMYH